MKQLSRKGGVACWLATLLVLFLVIGLLPTGLSKAVVAQSPPKLIIKKEVKNKDDAGSFSFTLNVEKKFKENSFDYVKYSNDGTVSGSGTFSFGLDEQFTLGHGEWIEFYGVKNEDFTLAEDISNEYDTSFGKSSGHNIELISENKIKGTVHNGQGTAITVTNTYKIPEPLEGKTSKLIIQKRIENQKSLPNGSYVFEFEIVINDDEPMVKTLTWTKNGHSSSGTSIIIDGIPLGALYSVKEVLDDVDDFTLVGVDSAKVIEFDADEGTASGTLAKGKKTVLTFRNKYTPSCDPGQEPDPDPDPLELIVEKVVSGTETNDQFNFGIEEVSSLAGTASTINSDNTFELGHGDAHRSDAVPGTRYKVTETPAPGYRTTATLTVVVDGSPGDPEGLAVGDDGSIEFDYPPDAESVTITFTNTWEPEIEPELPGLTVRKVIAGRTTTDKFEFRVTSPVYDGPTAYAVNQNDSFWLGHNEEEALDAEYGQGYRITETKRPGYTTSVSAQYENSDGIWQNLPSSVDEDSGSYSVEIDFPEDAKNVLVVFTNTWRVDDGDDPGDDPPPPGDEPPGEETPGEEPSGGEIVAGDEDEKPDEIVKGDEDEKTEDEELDAPVTGEGLSAYPFLALAMGLLAATFLVLGRRKPLEED